MYVILVAVLTFGLLFLIDKRFTAALRSRQNQDGLSVRLPRRNGTAGMLLTVLAVMMLITDFGDSRKLMIPAGALVGVMGIWLTAYYMTFGVFYDDSSFTLASFGKKSVTYRYADIANQKLYVTTGGSSIVELHMTDGQAVSLQSTMEGVYDFLDRAFIRWCAQKGIDPGACDFHDPQNSVWFPPVEE